MVFGFSVNSNKERAVKHALFFAEKLKNNGAEIVFDDVFAPDGYRSLNKREVAEIADVMVVFGGDGTVLRVAADCAVNDTPVFAVNLGKLGFLTEAEPSETDEVVDLLLRGDYSCSSRSMLNVVCDGKVYLALNESVVARGPLTKMIKIDAYADGLFVDGYYADGVIIATPTGSTAYSLSAGGPIVDPDVDAFVLTPVGSHSLHTRPIVFSDKKVIELKVAKTDTFAYLSIDGRDVMKLQNGEIVRISLSDKRVRFIDSKGEGFVTRLLDKLNDWSYTVKE